MACIMSSKSTWIDVILDIVRTYSRGFPVVVGVLAKIQTGAFQVEFYSSIGHLNESRCLLEVPKFTL